MKLAVDMGTIGDGSVQAAIRYCQDLEIEGISVPWSSVSGWKEKGYLEAGAIKSLRTQIEDAGIACAPMVAWISPAITAGGDETKALFDDIEKSMEAMAKAGIDTLMIFPPLRQKPSWEQLVEFYRKLMELAEQDEIRIATHTLGILSTYEGLTQMMQDAPSAYNGVCLCTGNVWHGEGEKIYDVTRKLGDKIFFVHIRNVKTGMGEKEFWLDKGDIDIPKVLQVLKEIGYDGFLRSEHLPTDLYGRHVPTLSGVSDVGSAWSTGYLRAVM